MKVPQYARQHQILQQYGTLCKMVEQSLRDIDFALRQQPPLAASLLQERMLTLIHRKQPAEGILTAEKLIELMPKDQNHLYNAACAYSLSVPLLTTKRKDQKEKHAIRAVELLRQAHVYGWKDLAHIKQDKDLDPLRERDDFKKLLAEMEKHSKTTPKENAP